MSGGDAVAAVVSEPAIVSEQTRPPDSVFTAPDALARAVAAGADWLWLLGDQAQPRPDALERLLEARALGGARPPVLLAGAVVDAAGEGVACELPAGREQSSELMELVAHRALPIRNATFANCLVHRDCFMRYGLPDEPRYGPFAAVQWSAAVLRVEAGCFVPASVVVVDATLRTHAARAALVPLMRTLRSGAWARGEAIANVSRYLGVVLRPPGRSPGQDRV